MRASGFSRSRDSGILIYTDNDWDHVTECSVSGRNGVCPRAAGREDEGVDDDECECDELAPEEMTTEGMTGRSSPEELRLDEPSGDIEDAYILLDSLSSSMSASSSVSSLSFPLPLMSTVLKVGLVPPLLRDFTIPSKLLFDPGGVVRFFSFHRTANSP